MTKHHRTAQLAQIHIAKKQLGLDDDTYRSVIRLISNNRTHTSSQLDYAERNKLLDHFKARGFKNSAPVAAKKVVLSKDPQHKMIRGLWLELFNDGVVLDSSEQAISRFVKNQTGVDRLEWLSTYQASAIIERLKKWLARSSKE